MVFEDLKKQYTEQEWEDRENYYIGCMDMLCIPLQAEPVKIMEFNARLDFLRTEASIDCAYIQREYEKYTNMYKNAEKEMFYILKKQNLDAGVKLTEKEVSGLVITCLNTKPLGNMTEPITEAYNRISGRFAFIKRLVDMLDQKQQSLFVLNGIYKTECTALNMSGNNNDKFRPTQEELQ